MTDLEYLLMTLDSSDSSKELGAYLTNLQERIDMLEKTNNELENRILEFEKEDLDNRVRSLEHRLDKLPYGNNLI